MKEVLNVRIATTRHLCVDERCRRIISLQTLTFGVQTLSSVCEHSRSISEQTKHERFADQTYSLHSELCGSAVFADRILRSQTEHECSLTKPTVCTPNVSVRRPNLAFAHALRTKRSQTEHQHSLNELRVCTPNMSVR